MKYKVGDKVKVVTNKSFHGLNIGDVIEISYIDEDNLTDGVWWFNESEVTGVLDDSTIYSPETTAIIEMFMRLHSGKLSDDSRIEWPTAVKMAKFYTQKMIETLESDYAVRELEKHKRILKELDQ